MPQLFLEDWVNYPLPVGYTWEFLRPGNGGYLAVGVDGSGDYYSTFSTDLQTWGTPALISADRTISDACWMGTQWVAVGAVASSLTSKSFTSPAGAAWTAQGDIFASTAIAVNNVTWNGAQLLAVPYSGDRVAVSADGLAWTEVTSGLATHTFSNPVWTGAEWILHGNATNAAYSSASGTAWSAVAGASAYYLYLKFESGFLYGNGGAGLSWQRSDDFGVTWTAIAPTSVGGATPRRRSFAVDGTAFAGQQFSGGELAIHSANDGAVFTYESAPVVAGWYGTVGVLATQVVALHETAGVYVAAIKPLPAEVELVHATPVVDSPLADAESYPVDYFVDVPVGTARLRIQMEGSETDSADLYTVLGAPFDWDTFEWVEEHTSYNPSNNELITLQQPEPGKWYVRVDVWDAGYDGATLTAFLTTADAVDLGSLGGNNGTARACSDDGTVVVGHAERPFDTTDFTYYNGAFRWTQETGMVDLGNVPADPGVPRDEGHAAAALGCSADGNVIVGEYFYSGSNLFRAFRWTQATGMVDLGDMGYNNAISAFAVSADGSVVVGRGRIASSGQPHAWRWTQAGGMVDLGAFGSFSTARYSEALAVSADGSVVIGRAYTDDSSFISNAFRWTEAGGMVSLGTLGGNNSFAYCCSADGSVVYGRAHLPGNTYTGFRWTEAGGMVDIGDIKINACSDDGSVGFGVYWPASNSSQAMAIQWTEAGGIVELGTLGGAQSEGWGASAAGLYGVGRSKVAFGYDRPVRWLVTEPEPPPPPVPFWTDLINCEVVE